MQWLSAACQSELQTAETAPGIAPIRKDGHRAFAVKGNLPTTEGGIAIEV